MAQAGSDGSVTLMSGETESEVQTRLGTRMVPCKSRTNPGEARRESDQGRASLVGTRLGPYNVEALIGAGGMGEVYRARDRRLHRAVALKMLPQAFSANPERLARLEREARLLASLNHPTIAMIHGLEEIDGILFLVLELVEGQTLADRLKKDLPSMEEVLNWVRQMAEGLEAAHERGIIHRDFKPANIKITLGGKVKILDFGLAKIPQAKWTPEHAVDAASLTERMNESGVILGTASYMSPEQATGRPLDKRTDIWAFGCVFYECLTGRKAFPGRTIAEIMASVLRNEPDWQALPQTTPEKMVDLMRRCLQKDPKNRLHEIADARIELQPLERLPMKMKPASSRFPRGLLIAAGLTAVGLAFTMILAGLGLGRTVSVRVPQPVVRSLVPVERGHWLDGCRWGVPYGLEHPTRTAMTISGDGRFMVYSAVKVKPGEEEMPWLYLRRFNELEAKPIAGTEGGMNPVLSPDDRWLGFWADGKLKKIPVEGGVPTVLDRVSMPFGLSWGADDQIIMALDWQSSGLSRISAAGGITQTLTTPDRSKEYSHSLPHCLPGKKGVLFTIKRHAWDPEPRVAILDLATRRWRVLLENAADARYVPPGHMAFLRQGTLFVVPFTLDRLEVTGQPVPVVEAVAQALNTFSGRFETAAGQYSVSASGSLIYAVGGIVPDLQNALVWVDQEGKVEPIVPFQAPFFAPRLSPDGQRIAYLTASLEGYIWILDLNRGTATKLISEGTPTFVVWSPEGRRVAFDWHKTGVPNVFWQAADGSSPMERLTQSDYTQYPASWAPDGKTLALVEAHPETGYDVLLLHLPERRVTPFLNSRFYEGYPEISPDGKWMAYVSDESGRKEVYVRPFPRGDGKWQISPAGGNQPFWGRNGECLFYRSQAAGGQYAAQVWTVEVQTDSGFVAGKPKLLFEEEGYNVGGPIRCWDRSADNKRFLMVKLEERTPQPLTEMVLVHNWFEELKNPGHPRR